MANLNQQMLINVRPEKFESPHGDLAPVTAVLIIPGLLADWTHSLATRMHAGNMHASTHLTVGTRLSQGSLQGTSQGCI